MTKKFVIFVDTQVDFMVAGSALYVDGAQDLIGKLNLFAYHLNPQGIAGALFTFDTHVAEDFRGFKKYSDLPESKQFPIHCEYGKPGWMNVINTGIVNSDVPVLSLRKGVFNMWEEADVNLALEHQFQESTTITPRDEFFEKLKADGVDTVVVVGVAADFCVKWTIDGLLERDFKVEVPRSLTTGIVRDIDTVLQNDFVGKNVTLV